MRQGGVYISHYLNDFPSLSHSDEDAQAFLDAFLDIMEQIGMPIAKKQNYRSDTLLGLFGYAIKLLGSGACNTGKEENQVP